jgi:hypothetical protein
MTIAEDTKSEQRKRNFFVFLFSVVSGISTGWLEAHENLFDKSRFQALHSMNSGFPMPVLFMASVLLGLFLAPLATNLFSQRGFSFWSLIPLAIWLGFGIEWIETHIVQSFIASQIEGLAGWVVMALFFHIPCSIIVFRIRCRQRRLAAPLPMASAGTVWPPPPQRP